jgi:hypothetical protein
MLLLHPSSPSDWEDFWRYLFLTLFCEAVAGAAALLAFARLDTDIHDVIALVYATI